MWFSDWGWALVGGGGGMGKGAIAGEGREGEKAGRDGGGVEGCR